MVFEDSWLRMVLILYVLLYYCFLHFRGGIDERFRLLRAGFGGAAM